MKKQTTIWIGVGIIVVLIYGLLDPDDFPFPQCPFLLITGWECPGCGSQRALHQFLHGHFSSAFHLNILFIPALIYVLTGYISMIFFPSFWFRIKENWYGRIAAFVILIVIILYWIGRNV